MLSGYFIGAPFLCCFNMLGTLVEVLKLNYIRVRLKVNYLLLEIRRAICHCEECKT